MILTVPHTASSSIGPFNFIGDKQVTVTLKRQPGVTLVVFLFCVFRTNSWKDARLCWWHLCIRLIKRGEIMLTIFSITMFGYKSWQQSSNTHYLSSACKRCSWSDCRKRSSIVRPYPGTHTVCLCLVHLQPRLQTLDANRQYI